MSDPTIYVGLYDFVNYSGSDLEDLCRLISVQNEHAKELESTIHEELDKLEMSTLHLDWNNNQVRAQIKQKYLEFYYEMSLKWLQLARWHEFELNDVRFYGSQTRTRVHDRLVHFMNREAELRNRAYHAGISVDTLRAQYIL